MNTQQNAGMTRNQEQQVVQGAVAAALAKATNEANAKAHSNVAHIIKANSPQAAAHHELPALIPRTDLLNQDVIFLANTLDRDAETIQYYDMKKGSKPTTVSTAYYKSTRPVKDPARISQMVQQYSKEFGTKEVILRERLVKSSAAVERGDDGSVSKESLDEWKNKLVQALTKVIMEI